MTRILRSKVFVRYILIGASFLLLCCIVLCGIIMASTQKEYREAQAQIATSRMKAALDDLNTQIDLLSDIAGDITMDYRFRKSYWQQGEFQQLELVTELENYRNWSIYADDFVLIYNNSNYVFMSSGYKSYLDIYAQEDLSVDPEWLRAQLDYDFQQVRMENAGPGRMLIFLPLRTSGYNQPSGYATMIVVCNTADVETRLRMISGLDGRINLTYNGTLIAGEEIAPDDTILCRTNSFVMRCSLQEVCSGGLIPHLSPLMIVLLALFTVSMIILFGYVNYRPIYGLTSKYVEDTSDELTAIDNMLANLIHSGNESRKQLRELYTQTRKTLLRSVLYGAMDGDVADTLRILDKSFKAQSYATFVIGPTNPDNSYDNLAKMIEELSDSCIIFYAIEVTEDHCLAVVAAMADHELQLDARDLLRSILAEYSERLELFSGPGCEHPEEIPDCYNEVRALLDDMSPGAPAEDAVDDLFDSIHTGNSAQAQEAIELWVSRAMGKGRRKYNEKSLMHDIIVAFLENAERWKLKMTEQDLNALVRAQSADELITLMNNVAESWCAESPAQERSSASNRAQSLCDFICQHYNNPNLSLDLIADEFGISVNTVCRIVKQQLGKTFREYLIILRLEEAKKRLAEPGATVADVCEAVGYSNLSYFIRSFKDYCGTTPSEYRRTHGK